MNLFVSMCRTTIASHAGLSPRRFLNSARLLVHQIRYVSYLRSWHNGRNPAIEEMLTHRPSLAAAVNRPYMHVQWNAPRRLEAIEQHYLHMSAQAHVLRAAARRYLSLGVVEARGLSVEFRLDSPLWFVHEGELSLSMFVYHERIYTIVFSLGNDGAYIGAIQGHGGDVRQMYRDLTHSLHGMRPRDILLTVFRMLCKELGFSRIFAISDEMRVSRSKYFATAESASYSNYDEVWLDHHGVLRDDGFYELPVEVARRSFAEIQSKKRSEYRKRYEMLDGFQSQLHLILNGGV